MQKLISFLKKQVDKPSLKTMSTISKDEAAGTSSSSGSSNHHNNANTYSSSDSSSVESIQNLGSSSPFESGDLSVFTFLMSKYTSPSLSYLPEESESCVHIANCHCACKSNIRPRVGGSSYGMSGNEGMMNKSQTHRHVEHGHGHHHNCRCDCTLGKFACQNSLFGDGTYSSLLSQTNLDGYLLRSLEKGVLYPVIHWSSKGIDNQSHPSQINFGSNSPVVFNQGIYRELKRVIPPDAWMHKSAEKSALPKRPTWLVLGYKSLEKTLDPTLETTWKEWTGTRHIYLNLRHDFDIQRISFYNRVHPQENLELFMYLVCMEIGNVDDGNVMWLLDFVQRTRVERMKGFLTVYTEVENEFSTISEEYLKYFNISQKKAKREGESLTDDLSGKKFIEKLLQELHDTPLVDYF